jgi:hypothetical protein
VSRSELTKSLELSPGRVSQLVGIGAPDVVQLKPKPLFALNHCRVLYANYQRWLETRKRGERYCQDEYADTLEGNE